MVVAVMSGHAAGGIRLVAAAIACDVELAEPEHFADGEVGVGHEERGQHEEKEYERRVVDNLELEHGPLLYARAHRVAVVELSDRDAILLVLEDEQERRHDRQRKDPDDEHGDVEATLCANGARPNRLADHVEAIDANGRECHHADGQGDALHKARQHAHELAEYPLLVDEARERHRYADERDEEVGDGQIGDVLVGHAAHALVGEHEVDDERVAHKTGEEEHGVEEDEHVLEPVLDERGGLFGISLMAGTYSGEQQRCDVDEQALVVQRQSRSERMQRLLRRPIRSCKLQ